jgi:hypothetical protein
LGVHFTQRSKVFGQKNSVDRKIGSTKPRSATEKVIPLCAACQLPLKNPSTSVNEKRYHQSCFVCFHCKTPLSGELGIKEGNVYCQKDYTELFTRQVETDFCDFDRTCEGCGEYIEHGEMMVAKSKYYHENCFCCSVCSKLLLGNLTDFLFNMKTGNSGTEKMISLVVETTRERESYLKSNP